MRIVQHANASTCLVELRLYQPVVAPHTREKLKRYAKAFYCSTAYNSTKVIIIYIDIKV